MALILVEKSEAIATITLNRPDAMNALSHALRGELFAACQDISQDSDIRALANGRLRQA